MGDLPEAGDTDQPPILGVQCNPFDEGQLFLKMYPSTQVPSTRTRTDQVADPWPAEPRTWQAWPPPTSGGPL